MEPTIRVGIADDNAMFRKVLRSTLGVQSSMKVVAEAEDGSSAIEMVEKHRPEIVLMDISMPGLDGFEATRIIRSKFPGTRVLVLTMHTEKSFSDRAYQAGACRFLSKGCGKDELLSAVKDCFHNC